MITIKSYFKYFRTNVVQCLLIEMESLKSFVVPFADGIGGLETSGGRPTNFENYPSLPAVESSSPVTCFQMQTMLLDVTATM